MLYLLIILLLVLLFIIYNAAHKDISNPAFLFTAPFIIMCIVVVFFKKQWDFELGVKTFFVILFGNIFFFIGTLIASKLHKKNSGINSKLFNKDDLSEKKGLLYIVLLTFQAFCYVTKIKYIINFGTSHGIANNLSKCIVYYNNVLKFTTNEVIQFPTWLAIGLDICAMFGIICSCQLAYRIISKNSNKKISILILMNYILSIFGGLLSGGRGGAIQPIVSLLIAYLIFLYKKQSSDNGITFKSILFITLCIIATVYFFIVSLTWIGRYEVHMVGRYISNYIGAQLLNLNYMLYSDNIIYSTIPGQETFFPIIQKISKILSIDKWSNYYVGAQSIDIVGYNTGNVFTCFYSYIKDLGYIGVLILPLLFGFLSQLLYEKAAKSSTSAPISFSIIVYSYYSYIIVFSFFADKFGSIFYTFNMVKRLILLYILYFVLYKISIKGKKIKIIK